VTTSSDDDLTAAYMAGYHKRDDEIAELRKKAGQRGARMQIMREFLHRSPAWSAMIHQRPQAADWFDSDGVPK